MNRHRSRVVGWIGVVAALVIWFGDVGVPRWWSFVIVPVVGWFAYRNWQAQRRVERRVERTLINRFIEHRS